MVLFDEFDKIFKSNKENDEQAKLLSLFDGTAGGKKMYIVTCNELYGLNDYIVNRPGRFHYHFRFEYPTATEIREYLEDKLEKKYYGEIDKVIEFAGRINLNYDCLRAIAFELNQGSTFEEAITELNILNVDMEEYDVYLYYETGDVLHSTYNRMQWAGEEYLLEEVIDEAGDRFEKPGEVYSEELIYWIGYIYRYWHYVTEKSSKDIYKQASVKVMKQNYERLYMMMTPEEVIEILKEIN